MENKKWYYQFSIKKEDKKEDGTVVNTENKYGILKPNRKLREDGELFFASEVSRFAKSGVLPKAAWNTILSNGGGSVSESDREEYGKLLLEYRDKSFEIQSLLLKSTENRTAEEKVRFDQITVDLEEIRKKIQSFEASQINIFENTAEAKARNRTILWWVTNLAFKADDKGEFLPVFDGKNFEEKLDKYDAIEEAKDENKDLLEVVRKFTYLITLWFLGNIEKEEDFKALDDELSSQSS
jgi:hypothetical protein